MNSGKQAESYACHYLKRQDLTLLERNFRCRLGEIDLVMRNKKKHIIFVEVRFRQSSCYGTGFESVTSSKQRKLLRTASIFLQKYPNSRYSFPKPHCRFDVVSVTHTEPTYNHLTCYWLKDAFNLDTLPSIF